MKSLIAQLSALILGGVVLTSTVACQDMAESQTSQGDEVGLTAAKGDCPDCDDAGPGAMIQAGLADRFYAEGDRWMVAYQFNRRHDMSREVVLKVAEEELPLNSGVQSARDKSPLFLFSYGVKSVHKQVFEAKEGMQVERDVATIEIKPGSTEGLRARELFVTEKFNQIEKKLEFEINDLLDPVSETIFTRSYPNGKRIKLTHKSRLRTGSSIFPHTIPRALVSPGYTPGADLKLSAELEAAADAYVPEWRQQVYFTFRFDGVGEEEGQNDLVYWAAGDLWPFYIETEQGAGLLLGFNDATAGQ